MNRFLIIFALSSVLQGCSNYKNRFDCPIPQGVGCHSVSEIESMIVERDGGEDVFYPDESKDFLMDKASKGCCGVSKTKDSKKFQSSEKVKRIWVAPKVQRNGVSVGAHYVQFTLDPQDRWLLLSKGDSND